MNQSAWCRCGLSICWRSASWSACCMHVWRLPSPHHDAPLQQHLLCMLTPAPPRGLQTMHSPLPHQAHLSTAHRAQPPAPRPQNSSPIVHTSRPIAASGRPGARAGPGDHRHHCEKRDPAVPALRNIHHAPQRHHVPQHHRPGLHPPPQRRQPPARGHRAAQALLLRLPPSPDLPVLGV